MKRVSDRGETSHPEATNQSNATGSQAPAARVQRTKQTDLYGMLENVQRRMLVETDGVLNIKDEKLMKQTIEEQLTCVLQEENVMLNRTQKNEFLQLLIHEILGFGPLEQLLADETTTDIMVIGPERVYVERRGKIYKTNVQFRDNAHLMRIIDRILAPLGRRVDESSPMVDARLPDGSRINAVVPPVALDGAVLTVRKFSVIPLTVQDLIEFGTASEQVFEFLAGAVLAGANVIVAGGSSSGKTTLLNVISSFIPVDERIVTIENAAELQLRQPHVVRLESRPQNMEGAGEVSIRDLVINSLRMRPDRIVVGEVRSAEAIDLLQAMNTGHEGSMGTLHANSAHDALSRLETMVLGAGMNLPVKAIRDQMASAINLIVHMGRSRDGTRRILNISEIAGLEGDMISLTELFRYESTPGSGTGDLVATGLIPRFIDRMNDAGVRLSASVFQPPTWSAGGGKVKTVMTSENMVRPAPIIEDEPEPSYEAPPAPPPTLVEPAPTVEFADMDELLTAGSGYSEDFEQDIPRHRPANDFSGSLPQLDGMEEEWSEESYQEPTSDVSESQQIKRGLLGRYSTNQGTEEG